MAINIAFRDRTIWSVRQVIGCDVISEGRVNNCLPVPDHWELLHRNGVVVSTALTEWFERVEEYMPSVEHYGVPDRIRLGEPFSISGAGYHEGDRVELSIEFIDQSKLPLGEVPLDHGAFRWNGEFPKTAPTGYAIVSMRVFEGAEEVGGLTVSTTVTRSTAAGATTPSPTPAEAEYSAADLARWYERLVDVTRKVPGIAWTDLNEARNRIEIGIYPLRGAREEWEAALATLDVPREAIVIEVGCEGIHPWPRGFGKPPEEAFLQAVDYSLELVPQAPYGETVRMKLTLRNVSDGTVNLVLGGRPPYDFEVSTPDGEQVWNWKCGKIINLPLDGKTLEPGEELEFVGEWEQVDNRGEPVPPGVYLMRGGLNWGPPNAGPPGVVITTAQKVECSSEIRRSYRSAGHWSALYSRLQRRGIDPHRYNDSGFARSRRPDPTDAHTYGHAYSVNPRLHHASASLRDLSTGPWPRCGGCVRGGPAAGHARQGGLRYSRPLRLPGRAGPRWAGHR